MKSKIGKFFWPCLLFFITTLYIISSVGSILLMFGDANIPLGVAFYAALLIGFPSYALAFTLIQEYFRNKKNPGVRQ